MKVYILNNDNNEPKAVIVNARGLYFEIAEEKDGRITQSTYSPDEFKEIKNCKNLKLIQ